MQMHYALYGENCIGRSIICNNTIKFYDIRKIGTYEDGLFNLLYFQYVHKAIFLNQYLYHYRRTNKDSITKVYNSTLEKQSDKLIDIMKNYIIRNNLTADYKEALRNRISLSLIPLGINEITQICPTKEKIMNIKKIISKQEYLSSIKMLKIQYMPFYWKVFFQSGKATKCFCCFYIIMCYTKKFEENRMDTTKKISILMGIYNCEATLNEAIDSILNQTYSNWEFIICDDGSKDNSYNIAKSYEKADPIRFKVIKNNENEGLNATLNRCLKIADGEFIARMDGDDLCDPTRFQKEVEILNHHPEYAIVSTYMTTFDGDGEWGCIKTLECHKSRISRPTSRCFVMHHV